MKKMFNSRFSSTAVLNVGSMVAHLRVLKNFGGPPNTFLAAHQNELCGPLVDRGPSVEKHWTAALDQWFSTFGGWRPTTQKKT